MMEYTNLKVALIQQPDFTKKCDLNILKDDTNLKAIFDCIDKSDIRFDYIDMDSTITILSLIPHAEKYFNISLTEIYQRLDYYSMNELIKLRVDLIPSILEFIKANDARHSNYTTLFENIAILGYSDVLFDIIDFNTIDNHVLVDEIKKLPTILNHLTKERKASLCAWEIYSIIYSHPELHKRFDCSVMSEVRWNDLVNRFDIKNGLYKSKDTIVSEIIDNKVDVLYYEDRFWEFEYEDFIKLRELNNERIETFLCSQIKDKFE